MTLVKESPPARSWRERLEPLKATPDEWFRVAEYKLPTTAYSVVSNLRSGNKETPAGSWDFRGVNEKGQGVVYARYLGSAAAGTAAQET